MIEKVRYGILGTANIARKRHMPAFRKTGNAEVVAVASRNADRARVFAAEFDIHSAYGNYDDLLADSQIDAVIVALPNSLHRDWVIKAATAGKHVLCEKPLAMNEDEVQAMIDAASKNNVLLMEGFMYRFHPQHDYVQEVIQSGGIGKVQAVRAELTYTLPDWKNDSRGQKELGGGALFDAGCYCVNAVRFLMGVEPVSVQAYYSLHAVNGVDKTTVAILKFPDDRMAYIATSMEQPFKNTYEVTGLRGRIIVPNAFPGGMNPTTVLVHSERGEVTKSYDACDHFQNEIEHFSDCILNNKRPLLGLRDSKNNTIVLQAIARAARIGKVIEL